MCSSDLEREREGEDREGMEREREGEDREVGWREVPLSKVKLRTMLCERASVCVSVCVCVCVNERISLICLNRATSFCYRSGQS